ncbi:MAG: outer membrane protein assembly factor BamA [Paracoccaceae bacterium]
MKFRKILFFIFFAASACLFVLTPNFLTAQTFTISEIEIVGNQRIETETIESYISLSKGQNFEADEINSAYQRVLKSGLFESVTFDENDGVLKVTVVEYPTINRIYFEGNVRIEDTVLEKVLKSKEKYVLDAQTVEQDRKNIAETYAVMGRLAARINPKVIKKSENRVDLIFEIFEGGVIEIQKIGIVGNKAFSDRRLRRVLSTKQAGPFRAFVRSDTFVEERIEFDKKVLKEFYISRGFVDFRVNSVNAELTEERDGYFVVFNITEGQRFSVGNVAVETSLKELDTAQYYKILKLKAGAVYSAKVTELDVEKIERLALKNGLDFIRVRPKITKDDSSLALNVTYSIERGPRVILERINIAGNTATLDKVIRRQFRAAEGDPFSARRIRQATDRIRSLGFFETVDVSAREGKRKDSVIVDVLVKEKPTGSVSLGGSYSTSSGFGLLLEYAERNFLGRGQDFRLKYNSGVGSRTYSLGFIEPEFLSPGLSLGLSSKFTETEKENSNYDTTILDVSPQVSFPISDFSKLSVSIGYNETELRNAVNVGSIIQNEVDLGQDERAYSRIAYTYNTLRDGLDPNFGVLLKLSQEVSGFTGDGESSKTSALARLQRKILNEEVLVKGTLEGGVLNYGNSRVTDRFFLGSALMRGFEPGGIGPREIVNEGELINDALGGNTFAVLRLEAEFSLGLPEEYGIDGGIFFDVGNLWSLDNISEDVIYDDGSWRSVLGASLFWKTPIGPLRFNFSRPLQKETFDREQNFDLTIRTQF